jgi:hypothetical protein
LFTDIEGSTRLLHELGAEAYAAARAEHRRLIREACAVEGGVEIDNQGDAIFFGFPTAPGALRAAEAFTDALASGPIRVRVGLHTGTPLVTDEGYVGGDVHRAARIAAAGHGEQVLVSASTMPLVDVILRDLGEHPFKDLSAPERVYQLGDRDFPRLKTLYQTNLPIPANPLVGRSRELSRVLEALHGDERVVTSQVRAASGRRGLRLPPRPRLPTSSPRASGSSTSRRYATLESSCRRSPTRWASTATSAAACVTRGAFWSSTTSSR